MTFPLSNDALNRLIDDAFEEDIGSGDLTSLSVIDEDAVLSATMRARTNMVLAGLPLALAVFKRLDQDVQLTEHAKDGNHLTAGDHILTIQGKARALLTAERTALNFVQHLSGIATLTHVYVQAIADTKATLLDTRKTIPGYRKLAKYATRMGGAANHRMGLYDAVMIKDNHIAMNGSITDAVARAKAYTDREIVVECDTLDQVSEAFQAGASRLLLDNMSLDQLRQAIDLTQGNIPLEASGGVTLETIADIAKTGVDFISVGRLTQSAPAIDIGLDFL